MKYDFDTVVDRGGNRSAKYDERTKKFGTDQVIPLWIADMDFKTAQPIIDALKARAEEGIWGYTSRPDSYFEAIRGWQKRRNGWDIDPSLMSFSLGVVQSISAMVKLFTPEGGSVLIQTPVYSEFYDTAGCWRIPSWKRTAGGRWTGPTSRPSWPRPTSSSCVAPTTPWASCGRRRSCAVWWSCASNTGWSCSPTRFTPT